MLWYWTLAQVCYHNESYMCMLQLKDTRSELISRIICKRFLGFQKLPSTHCTSSKYDNYAKLVEAKAACMLDSNCQGVYHYGCDDSSQFYLCPQTARLEKKSSSCVYYRGIGSSNSYIVIFYAHFIRASHTNNIFIDYQ